MAVDQETVSKIFSVLSHPLRRAILLNLSEKGELSFTDLMNALNVDTGKLSFHIRNLEDFLEQTSTSKYRVTRLGENAIGLINDLKTWVRDVDLIRKTSVHPIANLKKRAFASLIDFTVVFAVLTVIALISSITSGGLARLNVYDLLLFLFIFWVYLTVLEGFAGQSLGKRAVGLVVVRVNGKRPSYDHIAVRNLGKVFLLPLDLIMGIKLKDPRFIRYFDKYAGTTVLDLQP